MVSICVCQFVFLPDKDCITFRLCDNMCVYRKGPAVKISVYMYRGGVVA